jgi:signal transduction histidine kinase
VRVHHARPIIVGGKVRGVLLLSRSSRALFRGMYQDRGKILIGVGMIFAILVLLTVLLHRTIAKPIEALSRATRGVAEGRGDIPDPPTTAATEIRALYRDFGNMAEVIARRSRYLRDFASALAHEFKTPLAGLRGGIELIEDHHGSMSEADRARFLGNMSGDAERLSALVSRLLDLARADMTRPETGVTVDLAKALPRLADAMRTAQFGVTVDAMATAMGAAISAEALDTILIGLMENSKQAGATQVGLTIATHDDQVWIRVADNGPGINAADQLRLFEPFFTTRRSQGGTGLGLSIARSLLAAHQADIILVQAGQGALFEIRLKSAGDQQ